MNQLLKPLIPIYNNFNFPKEKFEVEVSYETNWYPKNAMSRHTILTYRVIKFVVRDKKAINNFSFSIPEFHPLYKDIINVNDKVKKLDIEEKDRKRLEFVKRIQNEL